MIVQIESGGEVIPFRMDFDQQRWHCLTPPAEGDFPLVVFVDAKRYELYSDGTFDHVEK